MPGAVPGAGTVRETVQLPASVGLPAPREERHRELTKPACFICSERSGSSEVETDSATILLALVQS